MMEDGRLIYQGTWEDDMDLEEFYLGTYSQS